MNAESGIRVWPGQVVHYDLYKNCKEKPTFLRADSPATCEVEVVL